MKMTPLLRTASGLASFPGLPHLQLLIASSMRFCILEAIKSWRYGRPGNEATSGYLEDVVFDPLAWPKEFPCKAIRIGW